MDTFLVVSTYKEFGDEMVLYLNAIRPLEQTLEGAVEAVKYQTSQRDLDRAPTFRAIRLQDMKVVE